MTVHIERPLATAAPANRGGWWQRHRATVVPVTVGTVLLVAPLVGVAQLGVDAILRLAGLSALLLIGFGTAAFGAFALMARRRLREMRHLPDLGHRFVTTHEDAALVALRLTPSGDVALDITSTSVQTVVLDEYGAPDRISANGPATSSWAVAGSASNDGADLAPLEALVHDGVAVRVISEGVIGLTGPVTTAWRLEAANGLVLTSSL